MRSPAPQKVQALTAEEADWRAEKGQVGSKLIVRRLTASWAVLTGTQPLDHGEEILSSTYHLLV